MLAFIAMLILAIEAQLNANGLPNRLAAAALLHLRNCLQAAQDNCAADLAALRVAAEAAALHEPAAAPRLLRRYRAALQRHGAEPTPLQEFLLYHRLWTPSTPKRLLPLHRLRDMPAPRPHHDRWRKIGRKTHPSFHAQFVSM